MSEDVQQLSQFEILFVIIVKQLFSMFRALFQSVVCSVLLSQGIKLFI